MVDYYFLKDYNHIFFFKIAYCSAIRYARCCQNTLLLVRVLKPIPRYIAVLVLHHTGTVLKNTSTVQHSTTVEVPAL